jgi:DNA polymerase III delta prime subunit
MFENIIGLQDICSDLRRDIREETLPGAILLSGPRYGGKSSIALELARGVTCREDGRWDCTCRSCSLHRSLQHPGTLLAGPRYFSQEISAAAEAFGREQRSGTRFLVTRSVRKLLRRLDPVLWAESKVKTAMPAAESLGNLLEEFEDAADGVIGKGGGSETPPSLFKNLEKIVNDAARLEQMLPHDPVPVDLVRAVAAWAYVASAGGPQIVIIEEAHTLQEGARNAMLKILEEPPSNTRFILTTSRRSAIIPTIRSRLRSYEVPERTREDQEAVQKRIFRMDEVHPSLREFFRTRRGGDGDSWPEICRDLLGQLEAGSSTHQIELRLKAMLAETSPRHGAEYFLDALEEEILRRLRRKDEGLLSAPVLHSWGAILRRYWARIDGRNMNPPAVLSGLILALRRTMEAK